MEGNQTRVVANWLREQEHNGKLWAVLLFLVLIGVIVGPDWTPPDVTHQRQQEVQRCEPLLRSQVDTADERAGWDTLTEQGWIENDGGLYPPTCEGAYR